MTARPEPDVIDMLAELTRRRSHAEPYTVRHGQETWSMQHRTRVPALVHQLLGATPSGSKEMSGSTPTSRPAAHIEALDTLILIDDEAARWLRRLGEDDPGDTVDRETGRSVPGSGTIACLQRLAGLLPGVDRCGPRDTGRRDDNGQWCCWYHRIVHDVRRWWRQARVISGWDTPAYRPFSTCPVCEHRGGLRINLGMETGFCVECRSVWGPDEIGLLADHIRSENEREDTPADQTA